VPEVRREGGDQVMDILTLAIPGQEPLAGEGVAQIMNSGTRPVAVAFGRTKCHSSDTPTHATERHDAAQCVPIRGRQNSPGFSTITILVFCWLADFGRTPPPVATGTMRYWTPSINAAPGQLPRKLKKVVRDWNRVNYGDEPPP